MSKDTPPVDQWCPSCGCCAGRYKWTRAHRVTGTVKNTHQCMNCGQWFDLLPPEKETQNG